MSKEAKASKPKGGAGAGTPVKGAAGATGGGVKSTAIESSSVTAVKQGLLTTYAQRSTMADELEKVLDEFVSYIADVDITTEREIMASLAYNGFSPVEWKREFHAHVVTFCKKDKDQSWQMILRILQLAAMRGTKIKDRNKIKQAGIEVLHKLEALGLDINPSKGTVAQEKITILRVVTCHPKEMSYVLLSPQARIVGKIPAGFPRVFCHSNAPALFHKAARGYIMDMWREWRNSFTDVITQNMKPEEKAAVVGRQPQFEALALESDLYDEAERFEIFDNLIDAWESKYPDKAVAYNYLYEASKLEDEILVVTKEQLEISRGNGVAAALEAIKPAPAPNA